MTKKEKMNHELNVFLNENKLKFIPPISKVECRIENIKIIKENNIGEEYSLRIINLSTENVFNNYEDFRCFLEFFDKNLILDSEGSAGIKEKDILRSVNIFFTNKLCFYFDWFQSEVYVK